MSKTTEGPIKAAEPTKFEKAYVVPAQLGDELMRVFGELPHKYSPIFGKVMQALSQCPRADVNLNIPKDKKDA